ncbi:MAG: hypothetical protein KJ023_22555 [Burkholderiaceae bacterium]|nr:hypothetical protein [Burkholderiaceae bacterium]
MEGDDQERGDGAKALHIGPMHCPHEGCVLLPAHRRRRHSPCLRRA